MRTFTITRQLTLLITGLVLCSCFPQAYSPSLDLAYDNLRRGQVRLGAGLEMAPHGESADENTSGVLPAVQAKAAMGLSTNSELHLKLYSNGFNGLGAVVSGNIRVSHGEYNDILLMPRIGITSIAGYESGYGGGGAVVWRRRKGLKVATWSGLGLYRGWYSGQTASGFNGAESGTFNGNAAVLYLGGSWKVSQAMQINFELNPMVQRDTYFNRSAFFASAKVGISFALNERRILAAERARNRNK